jgi:hypothetical protein
MQHAALHVLGRHHVDRVRNCSDGADVTFRAGLSVYTKKHIMYLSAD